MCSRMKKEEVHNSWGTSSCGPRPSRPILQRTSGRDISLPGLLGWAPGAGGGRPLLQVFHPLGTLSFRVPWAVGRPLVGLIYPSSQASCQWYPFVRYNPTKLLVRHSELLWSSPIDGTSC